MMMKKILLFAAAALLAFFTGCSSIDKLHKEAEKGDENARVLLGVKYFYGSYDVKMIHYDEARRFFELAAEQENPLACYYLGVIYENGLGQADVNYEKAKNYYQRAAQNMNQLSSALRRHGYLALGRMYESGRGFEKSDVRAKYFYEKAYNSNVLGSGPLMADFLRRTRGDISSDELENILEIALDNNEPAAVYMYALAVSRIDPKKYQELLGKAADANYSRAIIDHAVQSRNKMLIRSAYEKAAANGYGPAFYELALSETVDVKRYELLKKGADRGVVSAMHALGDYYENRKDWNRAVIYNYMADKIGKGVPGAATIRLRRMVGLELPVESIWQNKNTARIAQIGTNVEYFIRNHRAGIAKIRENYQRYLSEDPERAYINMDYVKLFYEKMPMNMAGDIFRIYFNKQHGNVGIDFYLNYAIAAGYAQQGEIQFNAVSMIHLNAKHNLKWHLAKMLLQANALALMNRSDEAYEFLVSNYRANLTDNDRTFIVDFVNANCNMLLKNMTKLSASLNIPQERFISFKQLQKQSFYDFDKKTDSNFIVAPGEPEL